MKHELKEVYWGRSYPNRLENEKILLVRKNWGFRLIYDIYLKDSQEFLGSSHVMEKVNNEECICKGTCPVCKCHKNKFVVKELVAKSPKLNKRIGDIQALIRERF